MVHQSRLIPNRKRRIPPESSSLEPVSRLRTQPVERGAAAARREEAESSTYSNDEDDEADAARSRQGDAERVLKQALVGAALSISQFQFTTDGRLSSLAIRQGRMESALLTRVRYSLARIGPPAWIALAVSLLGLVLRIEHAMTFDGLARGSDYESNVAGVRWMLHNMRPFDFTPQMPWSVRYQPPLWSAFAAVVLYLTKSERAIAYVAVFGWTIRQYLLFRIMKQIAPLRGWSALAALSISAVLPISILTNGKVSPENYHSTLFTIALYFLWRMERQSFSIVRLFVFDGDTLWALRRAFRTRERNCHYPVVYRCNYAFLVPDATQITGHLVSAAVALSSAGGDHNDRMVYCRGLVGGTESDQVPSSFPTYLGN